MLNKLSTHSSENETKTSRVFAAGFRLGVKASVVGMTVGITVLSVLLQTYVSMNGTLTASVSNVTVGALVVPWIIGLVLFAGSDWLLLKHLNPRTLLPNGLSTNSEKSETPTEQS